MLIVGLIALFILSFIYVMYTEIKWLKAGKRKQAIFLVVSYTVVLFALYVLTLINS